MLSDGVEMQQAKVTVPVLICGAGAAGLTAAATLDRYGIPTLLVERRTKASTMPRATGASLRTLEILRHLGVAAAVKAGADDAELLVLRCATLAEAAHGSAMTVGYPTRAEAEALSPETPLCVAQDHLEAQLRERIEASPTTVIRHGTELSHIECLPDGVRCELRDVHTQHVTVVHARYLIAADGAHSTVRQRLGIELHGSDDLLNGVRAQFRGPLWEIVGSHRYVLYGITTTGAEGSLLPAGQNDRWEYGVENHYVAHVPPADLWVEIQRRIRAGIGRDDVPFTIERISHFTSAAKIAERFRHGNVFLVGDAAHRVTPRGGTGMNTAIHDGFDLAWKLAWTLNDWATPAILDTYEQERRPVAEHNVRRSTDPQGSYRTVAEEIDADLGGRLAHSWLAGTQKMVSTLDLLGDGWTVLCGPEGQRWHAAASVAPIPVTVHSLDPAAALAVAVPSVGAVLVRPDGKPAGMWPDQSGIVQCLARVGNNHAANIGPLAGITS
jgi:2-polyprenyl-6-methoxyphenol hydroxylase-like FAD-dependent oxidoreductase